VREEKKKTSEQSGRPMDKLKMQSIPLGKAITTGKFRLY